MLIHVEWAVGVSLLLLTAVTTLQSELTYTVTQYRISYISQCAATKRRQNNTAEATKYNNKEDYSGAFPTIQTEGTKPRKNTGNQHPRSTPQCASCEFLFSATASM
jgi:hypothetical protein